MVNLKNIKMCVSWRTWKDERGSGWGCWSHQYVSVKEMINNPGEKWMIEAEGETHVASCKVTPSFISNHQIKIWSRNCHTTRLANKLKPSEFQIWQRWCTTGTFICKLLLYIWKQFNFMSVGWKYICSWIQYFYFYIGTLEKTVQIHTKRNIWKY